MLYSDCFICFYVDLMIVLYLFRLL